jgi:hypothetical protein
MDRRFCILVSWSGEGPTRTRWLSPPPWGPKAPPGFPSPPPPAGVLGVLCPGRLAVGGIISCESRVLRWVIRGRIAQEPLEPAEACGADGQQDAWSCACAGGVGRVTGGIALHVGRRRDEPQGGVREPVPEGGTGSGRNVGECSATRAAVVAMGIEARQCAVGVLGHSANGGQESRRGGCAAPGQWPQALGVRVRGTQDNRRVAPEWRFRQGVDIVCAPLALDLVKASQVLETAASSGQIREAVDGLWAPRPTTLAGWPLLQKVETAGAQERLWE